MTEVIVLLASKLHIVIVLIAIAAFVFAGHKRRFAIAMYGLIALPLSYVLGKFASSLYYTNRPFVDLDVPPLVAHLANNGFPSEHTLYAMVIALIIFLLNKRIGILLITLAILVGLGRVLALVHNPIDIIGSVFIAVFAVMTARYLVNLQFKLSIHK